MKFFKKTLKILIVIAVVLAVIFAVLSSLGGNSDTYKNAIENIIEENFPNYDARIDALNQMQFFPFLGVDIEGLELTKLENDQLVVAAEKVQIAMRFWDIVFSTEKISTLHVQNLGVQGGYLHPQTIIVERAAIITRNDDSFFEMNGRVGQQNFRLNIPMNSHGRGQNKSFSFPKDRVFDGDIDDIQLYGVFTIEDQESAVIKNLNIRSNDLLLRGDIHLSFEENTTVNGALNGNKERSVSLMGVQLQHGKINGTIGIENDDAKGHVQDIIEKIILFWTGNSLSQQSNLDIENGLLQ